MRAKHFIFLLLLSITFASGSCCSPEKAANRSPKQQEKCLAKQDEKERKQQEKLDKKAKKQHDKMQAKNTRKMMKQTKKQSNQYNTGKQGFFLFRWFRKG